MFDGIDIRSFFCLAFAIAISTDILVFVINIIFLIKLIKIKQSLCSYCIIKTRIDIFTFLFHLLFSKT